MKPPQYRIMIILILFIFGIMLHPSRAVSGQESLGVEWVWNQGDFLPQGNISSVTIIIRNRGDGEVTLKFVGVRFDWMPEAAYLYGDQSERERLLAPQEEVQFTILFNIPEDAVPGPHTAQAAMKYAIDDVDRYMIYEPSDPLNVIEMVTIVYTEVVVETVTMPIQSEGRGSTSIYAAVGLSVMVAVILALTGYTRSRRRRKGERTGQKG